MRIVDQSMMSYYELGTGYCPVFSRFGADVRLFGRKTVGKESSRTWNVIF